MQAVNMTQKHRADLRARNERARAFLRDRTEAAIAGARGAPPAGEPDREQRLWNTGGRYAGFFVVWVLMIWVVVLAWTTVFN